MPHSGASERASANDQPAEQETNYRSQINVFYRICNSSNQLKLQFFQVRCTFSFLLSLIHKWKQLSKYLHMLEWNHMLLLSPKDRVVFHNAPALD